ncbi:MAG: DUF6328 family protein [Actinomycetota bacterium]|nr:DUF6328 family protein [Actinomycetota bacterium]
MGNGGSGAQDEREGQHEEEQRERYQELLQETRTVIPGVQVLFAFLLAVPFSERFKELDDLGRNVFGTALLGVALATIVLLTPAAYHRVGPRQDRRERLRISVRLTVLGMLLLALSVAAAVFVVVRFVFDSTGLGIAFAGVTLVAVAGLWYGLPLLGPKSGADAGGLQDAGRRP